MDVSPFDQILEQELASVLEGRGRAVFVVAPPGRATEDRVAAFQEQAFRRHAKLRVAYVDCLHTTPEDDAWVQFERILTRRYLLKGSARRLAGDWLEVIPLVGPALRAVWVTVQALLRGEAPEEKEEGMGARVRRADFAGRGETGERFQARAAAARAASAERAHERASDLWTLEPLEPRLMVLENFQQAFPGELAGTSALVAHLDVTHTLFVAVARVEGALPPLIDDLILESERTGRARRVDLVKARPRVAPASELTEADRTFLARAAVEGLVLHPLFLERLLGIPELELEDRCARLVRAGALEERGVEELEGEPTGAYAFSTPERRQLFLDLLDAEERRALEERAADLKRGT